MIRALSSLVLAGAFATPAVAAEGPNVVFIVADDLNNSLGTYGHPLVKSPNIDGLAKRGVRFERAYTQYPLCSPSRTSFLTGRRPNSTRILTNLAPAGSPGGIFAGHFRSTIPDTVTMPQLFRRGGYFVARVGKMYHYGVPADIGTGSFDDYASWDLTINPRGRDREVEDKIATLQPKAVGPGPRFGGVVSWLAADGADDEHTDGIAATEAIKLLERFKKRRERFFLAVGFFRPHTPYVAPKKYFGLYPIDKLRPATLVPGEKERAPAPAFGSGRSDQDVMTDLQRREAIQAYYASISFMDAQVGRVLAALKRLGLNDNTIVVFASDHGYHLGEHGLWQKMSLFDQSARVPLIIAAPGARGAGKAAGAPVELVDMYPTLADLCGLTAPDYLEGKSLRPMLDDPTKSVKPAAFTQVMRSKDLHGLSVRTEKWHYVEWAYGEKGRQLYDTAADPQELNNLAGDPAHASTVAEMKALVLANWPKDGWKQ